MNVYDNANELAKAMRESHEYKKLKEAAAVLEKDPDAKKMVNEYLMVAQEVEFAKHQGKTPDQASVDKMQKLQGILNLNADAVQYLNALIRFQMMLMDVPILFRTLSKRQWERNNDVAGDFRRLYCQAFAGRGADGEAYILPYRRSCRSDGYAAERAGAAAAAAACR